MGLKEQGEAAKQEGMERAAKGKRREILTLRLALMTGLRDSPGSKLSVDDVTPPEQLKRRYADGGKWRGSAPSGPARRGLIRKAGVVNTIRPSRHRSSLHLWGLVPGTKVKVRHYIAAIEAELKTLTEGDSHGRS